MKIHEASRSQDDQWKVFAYRRGMSFLGLTRVILSPSPAIGSLRRCYKRITTVEDARQLPGIGQKTAEKASYLHDDRLLKLTERILTLDCGDRTNRGVTAP